MYWRDTQSSAPWCNSSACLSSFNRASEINPPTSFASSNKVQISQHTVVTHADGVSVKRSWKKMPHKDGESRGGGGGGRLTVRVPLRAANSRSWTRLCSICSSSCGRSNISIMAPAFSTCTMCAAIQTKPGNMLLSENPPRYRVHIPTQSAVSCTISKFAEIGDTVTTPQNMQ